MDKNFKAINEPILDFEPGSKHREELLKELERQSSRQVEIPVIIHGKEHFTGNTKKCVKPHDHNHILGQSHQAGEKEIKMTIESSMEAWKSWSTTSLEYRASIFRKVADLIAGPYRYKINAAAMLDIGKSIFQVEIDASCELIDFLNFNIEYAHKMHGVFQPFSPPEMDNSLEFRPLEGFVFAIAPFTFFSIGGNLAAAPALLGNTAIWKPASSAIYSSYYIMKLYKEAGLPDGVINAVFGDPEMISNKVLESSDFAGLHFTGSTTVFNSFWKKIGSNISNYKTYPKIVGETGGKDFILAHKSANPKEVSTAITRGAFEFQGQKCSAASRGYISKSIWNEVKASVIEDLKSISMGSPEDLSNFMTAVIHENSFDKIAKYIDNAKADSKVQVIAGGSYDKSKGYFIEPTVLVAKDPNYVTMREEIFGPVITIYVYDDNDFDKTLNLIDSSTKYALTGAVLAKDRNVIEKVTKALKNAAGNFYVNDKPTGAVVGKQPFGGARASGTNDKAGSMLNLLRWVSPRLIKETFVTPTNYRYPFLSKD